MAIPVKLEPLKVRREFREMERCCFCRDETRTWTALKDRTPGQQVACCRPCAEKHSPGEVPSKSEWSAKERAITEGRF